MYASSFERVCEELTRHEKLDCGPYLVPRFLFEPSGDTDLVDVGNPYSFYLALLSDIAAYAAASEPEGHASWLGNALLNNSDVVYLSFLRTGAALNGEIGTPLKQMALLPHLRRLGVTVLLTLPTGRIGQANRKGSRGSPFAVADPFTLDPSLIDPLIPGIDPLTQYCALVRACELLGIRCGSIVPAATLALDSPLIGRFPAVTYWWDLPPGTALRPANIGGNGISRAPEDVVGIDPALNARFADPPAAETVTRVIRSGTAFWRSESGLTPATACPDVLAGDSGTYSWADVAGIRFDASPVPNLGRIHAQAAPGDRAVQLTALAIAWRAAVLGERVFWVDVAARVPPAVLELACALYDAWDRRADRLCAVLASEPAAGSGERVDELLDDMVRAAVLRQSRRRLTFIAEELYSFHSTSSLHDAVVGPWVYCVAPFSRDLSTLRNSIRHHLAVLANGGANRTFLAGLGDHDTCPPDPELAPGLLVLSWLLPGSIPMLFTGHEHGAQVVINKEFGFNTTPQLRDWRAQLGDDILALFNDVPMPWQDLQPAHHLTAVIRRIMRIRTSITTQSLTRLQLLSAADSGERVIGYRRAKATGDGLEVYLNTSPVTGYDIDVPPTWRCVYSTHSDHPGPSPRNDGRLPPLAAAVYASPAIAAHIANDRA
jgi:hypothetical protein